MKCIASTIALVFTLVLTGCTDHKAPPDKGVQVQTPGGVNVNVDKDKGVQVQTPGGVNVDTNKDKVEVQTPKTEVNVDKGTK
jgi:hypothetical protein